MKLIYISKLIALFVTLIFVSNVIFAVGPPGLSGKTPPGLQGKTPYGWSQGQKKGWYKSHHHKWNNWEGHKKNLKMNKDND